MLKQGKNAPVRVGCQVAIVYAVTKGYLNDVAVAGVPEYEKKLFAKLENENGKWLDRIEAGYFDEQDEEALKAILAEMQR